MSELQKLLNEINDAKLSLQEIKYESLLGDNKDQSLVKKKKKVIARLLTQYNLIRKKK